MFGASSSRGLIPPAPSGTTPSASDEAKLIPINLLDFKDSPDFYRLMEPMQREQSARIIQRAWRKKKGLLKTPKYVETLNGPLSLRFIKLPPKASTKYKEHAKKIRKGEWLALDLNDPDAIRNFYAASAYRVISSHQLVTAILLHSAKKTFGNNSLRQYSLEQSAPYNYREFPTTTPAIVADVNERLNKIPEGDRCYFAINLTYRQALCYLLYIFDMAFMGDSQDKMHALAIQFISSRKIPQARKDEIVNFVRSKKNFQDYVPKDMVALLQFRTFLYEVEPRAENLCTDAPEDMRNMVFMMEAFRIGELLPNIEKSPDFNPKDPSSPLFCMTFLSMSAFNCMQQAYFGKDAMVPMYVAGRFKPLLIREADEGLHWLKLKQRRPVELPHPDLMPDDKPHNVQADPYARIIHDLFHIARCGINGRKSLPRAWREFLSATTGFPMSKAIWFLTDMDFRHGKQLRLAKTPFEKLTILETYIMDIFNGIADNAPTISTVHLLLIAETLLNPSHWEPLQGISVNDYIASRHESHQIVYRRMRDIIYSDSAGEQKTNSATHYVLRCLLESELNDADKAKSLCNALAKTDIVAWFAQWWYVYQTTIFTQRRKDANYCEVCHNGFANI